MPPFATPLPRRRSRKQGYRPFAFDQAIELRAKFDEAASLLWMPLLKDHGRVNVGDRVITHNGPAELTEITEDGGCIVTYRMGDCFSKRRYAQNPCASSYRFAPTHSTPVCFSKTPTPAAAGGPHTTGY